MSEIAGYGRLGTEPELKMVGEAKDKPVTEFRLFLSSLKKVNGETEDKGDWYSVSAWGVFAEPAARLLKKGDPVYLVGTMTTDRWEGEDGKEKSSQKIEVRSIFPHLPALESLDFKPRKSSGDPTGAEA